MAIGKINQSDIASQIELEQGSKVVEHISAKMLARYRANDHSRIRRVTEYLKEFHGISPSYPARNPFIWVHRLSRYDELWDPVKFDSNLFYKPFSFRRSHTRYD